MKASAQKPLSFEESLKEIEKIVGLLESDDLKLSDALQHFERGVELMRICDAHLKNAEGKLNELTKGENGEFIEKLLAAAPDSADEEGIHDE